ncbi:MAG: sigma-54-dependent Fis family transcriptional regulator [Deltaproteobacteria bacterium]|nr:sigma-54-dependent Fis family transcriptional regulator [Deltaproteobacteria bacterium]
MTDAKSKKLLVVDDEPGMREFLEVMLARKGYQVSVASSGREAIDLLGKEPWDLLLCDIRLGDISGLEVLRRAKELSPSPVVIMISAYATTETAVSAMNEGAYDYIPKPFDNVELNQTIENALEHRTLEREKEKLDAELAQTLHFSRLVGNSPAMKRVYSMIRQAAPTKTNILITGESGTGKELIARAIHEQSPRKDKPFVVIHCGGIPETLMESELFGHVKGAFTGATNDKKGLFEAGNGGTVFLDEVGELSKSIQVKLLRVIQERSFKPVGGTRDVNVDIRLVSATNKDLEKEVIAGNFREDLFYRLNVIELRVPPLRERKEDLRPLAQHFLDKFSREMGKSINKLSSYAIGLLQSYDFPGNIRELENIIERSVALSTTNIILPDSLTLSTYKKWRQREEEEASWDQMITVPESGMDLDKFLSEVERICLDKAMERAGQVKHRAAKLLGISMDSFRYRYAKHYGATAREEK